MSRDRAGVNDLLVLGWIDFHTRNEGLADELGGATAYPVWGPRGNAAVAVARYAVQFVLTIRELLRRRPTRVIVMLPPFPALVACLLYSTATGSVLVGDVHTYPLVSRTWRPFLGLTAWLLRRGRGAMVTNDANAAILRDRGVDTLVLDDTPRMVAGREIPPDPGGHRVVVSASFDPDEPVEAVLEAAAAHPELDVVVTGRDETGRTDGLTIPANVRLSGFVPRSEYEALLAGATVVCSLTTLDDCMQQAGYEAMAWGRPLVTSDTSELRDYFGPAALYCRPDAASIGAAWTDAVERTGELHAAMVDLGERKVAGRPAELGPLVDLLGLTGSIPGGAEPRP